jgi:hypothetical protein
LSDNVGPSEPTGAPASGRLAFKAFRNGAPLGAHEIRFTRQGGQFTAAITIDYVVKLAFVTLFRYRLRGEEIWQDGDLTAARFDTSENGKRHFTKLERGLTGFAVEGSAVKPYHASFDWRPATHWNKSQLLAPMINPQDGAVLKYRVKPLGAAQVADVGGACRDAMHFALEGELPLDLFYDASDIWAGLRAKAFDGSKITYLAES